MAQPAKGVDTFGECPISQVGDEFYGLWVNETGGLPKTLRLTRQDGHNFGANMWRLVGLKKRVKRSSRLTLPDQGVHVNYHEVCVSFRIFKHVCTWLYMCVLWLISVKEVPRLVEMFYLLTIDIERAKDVCLLQGGFKELQNP